MLTLQKINTATGAMVQWQVKTPQDVKQGIRSTCALKSPLMQLEAEDFIDLYSRGQGGVIPGYIYKIIIEPGWPK